MSDKGESSGLTNSGDTSSLRKKVKHDLFGSDSDSEELDAPEKSISGDKQEEGSSTIRKDSEIVDGPNKAAGSNDKQEDEGDQGSVKRDASTASFQLYKEALKKKIMHHMFGSESDSEEEVDSEGDGSNDILDGDGDGERDGSDKEANKRKFLDGSNQDLTTPLPETKPRTNLPGLDLDKRDTDEKASKTMKLDGSQDFTSPMPETKPRSQENTCPSQGPLTKTLIYRKILTEDDMSKGRLSIPMEAGRKFLPEPGEHGINENITASFMDHNGQTWSMEVLFHKLSTSYMLGLNWEAYVKQFKLEAGDIIFIYHDPTSSAVDHCLIECEKKADDSNPIEIS